MSKASFHGHQEEEEGDYVYMTPPHPHTSGTGIPIDEEDHPMTVAPIQRPQRIRKQSQFLQTPYTNPDPAYGRPGMPMIFDPMRVVNHQKRASFMRWYNSDDPAPVTCGVGTRDRDWFKAMLTEHVWLHSDVSGFLFFL